MESKHSIGEQILKTIELVGKLRNIDPDIKDIILTPRQKVSLDNVIGMVKKENCDDGSWDINNDIYQ